MKWQHTIVWFCPASQHKSELFDSKIGLEQHIQREHWNDFTESQLPILIQKCAQPSSDPFAVLTCQNNMAASESMRSCPLSPFSIDNVNTQRQTETPPFNADDPNDGIEKTIRNHIAAHLESIALLSLPEQNDLDNAASDELQSESAKNSSRQGDKDLPEAIFDHNDDVWQTTAPNPNEIISLDLEIQVPPVSELEDWDYFYTQSRQKVVFPEPYQDPVLKGFVEEARDREMAKLRLSLIPMIRVYDDQGLEVPEKNWIQI